MTENNEPGTALVVGAGSGIGRAIARLLAGSRHPHVSPPTWTPIGEGSCASEHENIAHLGDGAGTPPTRLPATGC